MTEHQASLAGDERIRALIREHALNAAEGPFKAEVRVIYELFDAHNAAYFGGELRPVTITISPPQSAKAVADASEHSGWGGHQEMRIRPSVVEAEHPTGAYAAKPKRGWRMRPGKRGTGDHHRWLSDLVLHEMIHLLLNQRQDPRRYQHQGHGVAYTDECNRIGAMLGLSPVKARRRKGEPRELPISAEWPSCVRPGGEHGRFYGDLWERVEVGKEEPEEPATADERMLAIWLHEDTTDAERERFVRKLGLRRAGTAEIVEEPIVMVDGDAVMVDGDAVMVDGDDVIASDDRAAPEAEGEWLNIKRAARRLGVDPKTIRRRIERGDLSWRPRGDGDGREVWIAPAEAGAAS